MKKSKLFAFMMIVGLVLTGCGAAESAGEETAAQTIQIEDSTGPVEVPADPQRVVVFDMGMLDTMDELGLEDKVVGVPKKSLPSYLSHYEREDIGNIGTLKEPDFEAISALDPDVIFISGRQQSAMESLSEIAPTVFFTLDHTDYWTSFEDQTTKMAEIFSKGTEAEEKLEELSTSVTELNDTVSAQDITTLTVLLNEGNLSAYGSGSRFGILNDTFGFESTDPDIEASTHGESVSYEYVLNQNPDVLFVVDRTTAIGGDTSNNNLMNNPLIQETAAYQSDTIVYLDPEIWYLSGGGLQSVKLMIEEAANVVQ